MISHYEYHHRYEYYSTYFTHEFLEKRILTIKLTTTNYPLQKRDFSGIFQSY